MVDIPVDDVAAFGVVHDIKPYELPPEAWSTALNVRTLDDGIEWCGARTQVFGTPGVAPHFAMPVLNATAGYLIYTSLTKAYVYDGSTHTDITRAAGGDYTATQTRQWNGVLFGGIPIINNGIDTPQYWDVALNTATDLAPVTNWPASGTARVIRALGPVLVAFDVTLSSVRYPHAVLWSHPADPGSLPSSWDHTDPTKDAGLKDLPDTFAGIIREALPLRGQMMIYKDGSTWRMSPINNQFIFQFETLYESTGILAPRCVCLTPNGNRHFLATQDDIVVHDGAQVDPTSVLDKRMRRYLQTQLDSSNYINSFAFLHPSKKECWFCYPSNGNTNPNMAIIWKEDGTITEAEVDFRNAVLTPTPSGAVSVPLWSTATGDWVAASGAWAGIDDGSTVAQRITILCNTDKTEFHQLDSGTTNDGSVVTATLQRTGLSITGRKRTGEWVVDYHKRKQLNRVRPKVSGGPVNVRVGFQEFVDGDVTWSDSQAFDPTTMLYVDFAGSGQAVCIEFSASVPFRLEGYVVDLEVIGEY